MSFTPGPGTVRLIGASAQGNPTLPISATWNSSGTTFTGIRFDVTDTASAAGSLLMDLRVGGVSQIQAGKAGRILAAGVAVSSISPSVNNGSILFNGQGGLTAAVDFCPIVLDTNPVRLKFRSDLAVGWTATIQPTAATDFDLSLFRDAADTLAQRRGVNAQTSRIYGTFTDASNYRRVAISVTTGGVASIKPEGAGTGASGNVLHISGLPTANPGPGILWDDGGTVKVGT